jgi:hypothetical protein
MFTGRAWEIDLLPYAQDILHRYDQKARWRIRQISFHRRKVGGFDAPPPQRIA